MKRKILSALLAISLVSTLGVVSYSTEKDKAEEVKKKNQEEVKNLQTEREYYKEMAKGNFQAAAAEFAEARAKKEAEEAEQARLLAEEEARKAEAAAYQASVSQNYNTVASAANNSSSSNVSYTYSNSSGLTPSSGVNYHNGWKETYYSSNVLYHYRTGEWTVGSDGVYRDSDGYVVVASSSDSQGSVVDTSFGAGKVYDTGCDAGTHDIYTNW